MKRAMDYVLGTAVFLILLIIVVSVTWQVLSRYVLGTPSTATSEIARLLFMWLALLGRRLYLWPSSPPRHRYIASCLKRPLTSVT